MSEERESDMGQTVVVFIILAVVFIILPTILKRLTGKDIFEVLVGRPLVKKQKTEDAKGNGGSADPSSKGRDENKEKNSSKADILQLVSEVVSFARRNQFSAIVPGALRKDELETMLPVILVMRSCVVGINVFGYGGAVSAKRSDDTWTQTLNGATREIPSPLKVSGKQEKILKEILRRSGYESVGVSVISVFTSKDVKITGPSAQEIIRPQALVGELRKNKYMKTKDVDTAAVGKVLADLRVRKDN